jgi:hypothetical protein
MSMLLVDPRAFLFSATAFAILYFTIIPAEEEFLGSQFGGEYKTYCASVPRLIPRLTHWKSSNSATFQWEAAVGELRIALILVAIYALLLIEEHLDRTGIL